MQYELTRQSHLKGELLVSGDKSISHRSIMFGAISNGITEVSHFLQGADCLSTISCFKQLGIHISNEKDCVTIHGKGLHGLTQANTILDAGNSGTTVRLMSGILAGQSFSSTITGDASIQKRPMKRIIEPLSQMGASISYDKSPNHAPFTITGGDLTGIHYHSPIASAQVKSCILLGGLYANTPTHVTEPYVSRNHTELLLNGFGANITTNDTCATILPNPHLIGQKVVVPADISSAAYFLVAALITEGSELLLQNVGINPTRNGILRVIQKMGGDLTIFNERSQNKEPVADLLVRSSSLHGITIEGSIIPTLIDEIPIIAILAAVAKGSTIIKDAAELKVKESNRIDIMVSHLKAMGCDIEGTEDGMLITGGNPLHGIVVHPHHDHRIAMSFAIAGLVADGTTIIKDAECANISYPSFYKDLDTICTDKL